MAEGKINHNALGQALDTTWGRSSTPKTASHSVKFTVSGDLVTANYAAIVNFASEREMAVTKRTYSEESKSVIDEMLKHVKATYKNLSGLTLKLKEISTQDSVEIIGFQQTVNPKRTALFRKKTLFEIV